MIKAPSMLKNFMYSALMGGLLLSSGGVAYASEIQIQNSINNTKENVISTCPHHKHKHKVNPEKIKERMQSKLAPLVKSGELSQSKADKVVEHFYKSAVERKAQWQKAKNMEPEERKAYIKKLKENRKRPLVELVDAGVITQQEADSIRKVMHHKCHRS